MFSNLKHLTQRSKLSGDGIEEVTCSLTAADTVGGVCGVVGSHGGW